MATIDHLHLRVPLDGDAPHELKLTAYAFAREGGFVASAPVDGGQVRLAVPAGQARTARLFVGPTPPDGEGPTPTLALMRRIRAWEPAWTYDPAAKIQALRPIPADARVHWALCRCRIHGRVVRRISAAGVVVDAPVCNARVHICEVDPIRWWVDRLPDDLIDRLRHEVLRAIGGVIPIPPLPDPPPFAIDPALVDPSPENRARRDLPAHLLPLRAAPAFAAAAPAQAFAMREPAVPLRGTLPAESLAALTSGSLREVRRALAAHAELLRPILCGRPGVLYFPLECDEFAVVDTDANGRFDAQFVHSCDDQPDLHFWVESYLGGAWTTVYDPPLRCSTYWDYDCSSEITIRVTDPRVPVCGGPIDSQGKSVTLLGIGENVSTHEIQMTAGATQGLTTAGEPFGGILEPRALFGRPALFAAGITHYRWSYRRLTTSDGTTPVSGASWHHLTQRVIRHYELPGTAATGPSYPVETLGVDPAYPGYNVFRIQPLTPSDPNSTGWVTLDSHEDTATAFFPTHLLADDPEAAAGRYELKLELFRIVGGAPHAVNLTDDGVNLFIPGVDAPFGASPITPIAATSSEFYVVDPATLKKVAFRVVVRIDNNVCHGNVIDVTVGAAAAGPCGFLEYAPGASAQVAFFASHPHDFATFSFSMTRGSSGQLIDGAASGPVGAAATNGFLRAGTVFTKTMPVTTLLGGPTDLGPAPMPPCTRAAFAESLGVYALATDGWYRLGALDAPRGGPSEIAVKAFAVEPASTP